MGAKPGQSRKSGRQRLALVVFGALFVVLFAGFAIAQGIGQPSVPSGDVAIVKHVPSDIGTISEAEFKRALLQQVAAGSLKKAPKPGEKKYEELKEAALGELLDSIWIQGEAEELGISATPKQIATELAQIKKQNFKTEAAYQEFLKTSHFTQADVNKRVKLQVLSTKIQEQITKEAPPPSASRNRRLLRREQGDPVHDQTDRATSASSSTKTKRRSKRRKALLEKDDSAASWKKVAAKYSTDPTTKTKGGLQKGLTEELLPGRGRSKKRSSAARPASWSARSNVESNYFVIEVEKLNPEKVQPLAEVRSQINTQLTQKMAAGSLLRIRQRLPEQVAVAHLLRLRLRDRTLRQLQVARGHPASAPPACYEANPKDAGRKNARPRSPRSRRRCPARHDPQTEGEQLPQRPQPEGLKEACGAARRRPRQPPSRPRRRPANSARPIPSGG